MSENEPLHWSGEATLKLRGGSVVVSAYATDVPGLVVHLTVADPKASRPSLRHHDYWNVTHATSGLALAVGIDGFSQAQAIASEFGQVMDWTTFATGGEFTKLATPEMLKTCRLIRDGAR